MGRVKSIYQEVIIEKYTEYAEYDDAPDSAAWECCILDNGNY